MWIKITLRQQLFKFLHCVKKAVCYVLWGTACYAMVEAWFQPVVVEVLRKWKTGWGNGGDFLQRIPSKFDLFATESSKYLCTSCSPSFSLRPLVGLLIACKHGELCRTTDLWWAHLISSEIEGWKSWKHGVNVAVSRQLELCFSSAVASFQGHNWVQFFLFF